MKAHLAALLSALACLAISPAFGADSANDDQIFEASVAPTQEGHHVLVMVMPDMAEKVRVAVNLQTFVGVPGTSLETAIRGQVYLYNSRSASIVVEGIAAGYAVGANAGIFDMANAFGGGFRVELPVLSDGHNNALMVAPGIDFMYLQAGQQPTGYWTFGSKPYTDIYLIGTNVDVSYLHMFANHFGVELGASAGLDVSLGGKDGHDNETAGHVYPKLMLFGGFRF